MDISGLYTNDHFHSIPHIMLGFSALISLIFTLIYLCFIGRPSITCYFWLGYLIIQNLKCSNNLYGTTIDGIPPVWSEQVVQNNYFLLLFTFIFQTMAFTSLMVKEYPVINQNFSLSKSKSDAILVKVGMFCFAYFVIGMYISIFHTESFLIYGYYSFGLPATMSVMSWVAIHMQFHKLGYKHPKGVQFNPKILKVCLTSLNAMIILGSVAFGMAIFIKGIFSFGLGFYGVSNVISQSITFLLLCSFLHSKKAKA